MTAAMTVVLMLVTSWKPVGDRAAPGERRLDRSRAGSGIVALQSYLDPRIGFSLAVPEGWRAIVVAPGATRSSTREPGYAIAFEPPRTSDEAVFTDQLIVEILPGTASGLFETEGRRRRAVVVDGRTAWREELTVPLADERGDLFIGQALLVGLGHTVGFYVIGDLSRRSLLDEALEAMLRTFHLPIDPFDVS